MQAMRLSHRPLFQQQRALVSLRSLLLFTSCVLSSNLHPPPPAGSETLPAVRALATSSLLLHSSRKTLTQTSHPFSHRQWDSTSNAGSGRFAQPPEELSQFFIHLALCNTVVPGTSEDGTLQYQVSGRVACQGTLKSGEEKAWLVTAAKRPAARANKYAAVHDPTVPLKLPTKIYPAACCA